MGLPAANARSGLLQAEPLRAVQHGFHPSQTTRHTATPARSLNQAAV